MNMALVSLLALLAAIIIGFVLNVNVGMISIALAYVIGLAGGFTKSEIVSGFSSGMAITLIGVMYLFAVIGNNGALNLLAKKICALCGKKTWLLYIAIFAIGVALSASGPGAIPTLAIVPVIAIPVALKAGINPILLSMIGQMGAQAVRMCPITPEAVVVANLMTEQGLEGNTVPAMICLAVTEIIMIAICFVFFKGWKINTQTVDVKEEKLEKFTGQQLASLAGLLVMILAVVLKKYDVGLTSFVVASVLLCFKCADGKAVIKAIPWNTILLVLGVGTLMNIVKLAGGVALLSEVIANVSSAKTIAPMMDAVAGFMSFFASGLGVVFPTLIPTVGGIAEAIGGVNAVELMSCVVIGGTITGFTPISTAGALIMAGVSQFPEVEETYSQKKMFIQLFVLSFLFILASVLLALLGVYAGICA